MMKRVAVCLVVLGLGVSISCAANPFDQFKAQLTGPLADAQGMLNSFAKDLGVLMGGGSFHQGKSLGLPGFDVGIHVPVLKVQSDDTIIKQTGLDSVALPILQAEIGLPANLDLLARFTSYNDATMVGVGLRYGIIKQSIPGVPSLSAQIIYNTLNVNSGLNKLKATTLSVAGIASIDLPIITPYAGIGMDQTEVTPDSIIGVDLKGKNSSMRLEAGVNLTLFPFTYVQLGGVLINGDINYTVGFGAKF